MADAGSFNKAAEKAFITPTAVIKQINLLEEGLGVKLFERTHRGLNLTKAVFLPHCRNWECLKKSIMKAMFRRRKTTLANGIKLTVSDNIE